MLVVDDEETILFAMREYFAAKGFAVDCASEREEAEALITHRNYAVVIADLRLNWLDRVAGLDIIRLVRREAPGTRIALLTAFGSPEIEAEARSRGVDAILHKPQPLSEISRVVSGLLATEAPADAPTGSPNLARKPESR
jgi:DNA-binding response OmpR family regulator